MLALSFSRGRLLDLAQKRRVELRVFNALAEPVFEFEHTTRLLSLQLENALEALGTAIDALEEIPPAPGQKHRKLAKVTARLRDVVARHGVPKTGLGQRLVYFPRVRKRGTAGS